MGGGGGGGGGGGLFVTGRLQTFWQEGAYLKLDAYGHFLERKYSPKS